MALVYSGSAPESNVRLLLMSDIGSALARRVRNADLGPETRRGRPLQDEVGVGNAHRAQIDLPSRAEGLLELGEATIVEVEPLRELGAQLRRRSEGSHRVRLPLDERKRALHGV